MIDCGDRLEVLRLHADDAVGPDVELDLDLDLAARGAPQAGQHELAEQLVLLGAVVLALQDEDFTDVWLSLTVVKTLDSLVGTVVFCSISFSK